MIKQSLKAGALGLTALSIFACDPVPRHTLTTDEKIADLYWIYSQFGENYAPLEMKQKLHGFDYEKLKVDYLEAAKKTTTNDEFYDLMFKFVAEFKDAHTSAALTNSSLPKRAEVAFLGFGGFRDGDALVVNKLLPTINSDSNYPIKTGDRILKIDGVVLKDAIRKELLPLRNLGNDEANITYHMNKLFTRMSTVNGLPGATDAVLTLEREGKTLEIKLPWVKKDLYQFQAEQDKATAANKKTENFLMVSEGSDPSKLFTFNFIGFDGRVELPFSRLQKVMAGAYRKFKDGFRLLDDISSWSPVEEVAASTSAEAEKTPLEILAKRRKIFENAVYIEGSKTYPAYVAPRPVLDKNGKETKEKQLVGYILVDTFSPNAGEDEVLKEFKATLSSMQDLGVKNLIIDTINNGGGSLVLGMKMAALLSPEKIEMPKIRFRLSDSWLDQFESESLEGNSDAEREYSRRLLNAFIEQKQNGERLSNVYSADVLSPFSITPNSTLEAPFKVTLLVNEMCASMCDIFAGILQDNQMATLIGQRTMGAGGNVVNHQQAPNSHLELRQTESLMVRKGSNADQSPIYIENAGISPEIEMKTFEMAKEKYGPALKKAAEVLLKKDS
jgi:C-terminal processing protease CtpA/Prc